MKMLTNIQAQAYGFAWDQVQVVKAAKIGKSKIIDVYTPREMLQITITPTGLIRVFKGGIKLK